MKQIVHSSKAWQVPSGFNLYVDISSACNASCAFCIAPTVGRKDGTKFFDGAKFALDLTERVGGTVQIVGGEPMISSRLPALLREISTRDYQRAVVNTNGSFVSDKIISAMKAANITHVNISRHHYNEQRNQEVMHLRPELHNNVLASSVERISDSGIDVRMQCNLIDKYVDSLQGIIDYSAWCAGIGCKKISFSQVFPLGLFDYQTPIEVGYTEKVQVDLRSLVVAIEASGKFLPIHENHLRGKGMSWWGESLWGSGAKRRFWFGPQKTYISLKTLSGYDASGLPKETTYNKKDDGELQDGVLAFAVLHPDGLVTASWDRRERQLFNPYALTRGKFEVLENLPQPRAASAVAAHN